MEVRIAPSLLSADFADLTSSVRAVESGGAKYLHFDVMDGHFVPNITFGQLIVKALRPITDLKFLVHLMIYGAERYVEEFAKAGADSIEVHAEACVHLHRVVQQIKATGARAGVALNPSTPLSALDYVMDDIDSILIMTVNPGFGGQKFIDSMLSKIQDARSMVEQSGRDIDILVDGGVDYDTCKLVAKAGANILVAGSSVFNSPLGATQAVKDLEDAANSVATSRK